MKRHDIYNGVEWNPEGAKYWQENAVKCSEYVERCGTGTKNCPTCMHCVSLNRDMCEEHGIEYGMYCMASVGMEA